MVKFAVIGGTGVYHPNMLQEVKEVMIDTPFGTVESRIGVIAGRQVAFIARHGKGHSIPPHLINYRANIWALKKLGVTTIIATTAVGSLLTAMAPGDFVLPDQFLDFTKSRICTFYEGGDRGVVHVDVTEPYCTPLRNYISKVAIRSGIKIHDAGCYVCTEGPRFETSAEVKMLGSLGGSIVGMTGVPEVVLAREAEMCYASISMVTNYGAGMSTQPLTHGEVLDAMRDNSDKMRTLLTGVLTDIDGELDCSCRSALQEFGGFKL